MQTSHEHTSTKMLYATWPAPPPDRHARRKEPSLLSSCNHSLRYSPLGVYEIAHLIPCLLRLESYVYSLFVANQAQATREHLRYPGFATCLFGRQGSNEIKLVAKIENRRKIYGISSDGHFGKSRMTTMNYATLGNGIFELAQLVIKWTSADSVPLRFSCFK